MVFCRFIQVFIIGVSALTLTGCTHLLGKNQPAGNATIQGATLGNTVTRGPRIVREGYTASGYGANGETNRSTTVGPSRLGPVPILSDRSSDTGEPVDTTPPKLGTKSIDTYVAPLQLPQFIDAVFGEMLKTPYVTGPNIAKRTDIVQLRSSGAMKSLDFYALISDALEEYGVRIVPENGVYKIVEDKALLARIPQFIKSRARLRTPNNLRPVIQFVELKALDSNSMLGLLKQAFGSKKNKIVIKSNPRENYISLSGLPKDVDAAIKIIRELDELNYAGTQVRRYSPRFWNVTEMSAALANALRTEGWQVSTNVNQVRTIALMPVEYSNDLFIFTKTENANSRAFRWLEELDKPVQGGDTEQFFIYQVKNVDATILAETANAVLVTSDVNVGSQGRGAPANIPSDGANISLGSNAFFTVDPVGNRIIFTGTAKDYDKLVNLLRQLDTPALEVLIEVKIAEVVLTDESSFGVEFFVDDLGSQSVTSTFGSKGLGLGASGMNIGILSGNVDASLNAFASNRKVNVLSTPTLIARSGGAAQIQVGQDVPIITSQRAANNQNGGAATDILQSISYRKTGVLMAIEPIVFSENRIDLTITQEVSSTLAASNSSLASPTISNRSISTQLSLEDGQTAVLGGLIQEDSVRDEKGIPILKDIPFVGQAFSVDGLSSTRTELVMLITAYVLRGQEDKARFVRQMSGRVDNLLLDEERFVTLLPKQF